MKLINSIGPNPRMVRMFIAEKGMTFRWKPSTCAVGKTARTRT